MLQQHTLNSTIFKYLRYEVVYTVSLFEWKGHNIEKYNENPDFTKYSTSGILCILIPYRQFTYWYTVL